MYNLHTSTESLKYYELSGRPLDNKFQTLNIFEYFVFPPFHLKGFMLKKSSGVWTETL